MNRQHPCPHFALQIIQILAICSEIWIHRHYLLTDPRTTGRSKAVVPMLFLFCVAL